MSALAFSPARGGRVQGFSDASAASVEPNVLKRSLLCDGMNPADRAAFASVCWDVRETRDRHFLFRAGQQLNHVLLIVEGWAARARYLPTGERFISGFLLPGDLGDTRPSVTGPVDHSIIALTPLRVAHIPVDTLDIMARQRPEIRVMLDRSAALDHMTLRTWLENSRKSAAGRIAHLICELHARVAGALQPGVDRVPFPLTQSEIADAVGLTAVHVNRVLRDLRAEGVIVLRRSVLTIVDRARLVAIAGFDGRYLQP